MNAPAKAFVIDASVLLRAFLRDELHTDAVDSLLDDSANGMLEMHAPLLLQYEVANALRTAVLMRRITVDDSRKALQALLSAPVYYHSDENLLLRGLELALLYDCAVYDSVYLALGERLGVPLITGDRRLYDKVHSMSAIIWVGNYRRENNSEGHP